MSLPTPILLIFIRTVKIHLGQSLHTRKCNTKHRIEWNILQTHNIVKVKYAMTIARKCSAKSCFTMMIKIERLFIVDWTTTTTTTTMTMTTIHACARTSITLALYIFFRSFCLINNTCIILVFYVLCDSNAIATVVLVHVFCYPFVFISKFPSHLVDVIGKQSSFRRWNVWIMNIT